MNRSIITDYTEKLMDVIHQRTGSDTRTYGFEYEFLATEPLSLKRLDDIHAYLPECGFLPSPDAFRHSSGLRISFEPGGQIEYQSLPLYESDDKIFRDDLALIRQTNAAIKHDLGIDYIGTGYIPNRGGTALCLTANRYKNLHARMPLCGTRGREMMKGTASIHLHVLIRDTDEIASLFSNLCAMAHDDMFKMGPDRRDIWDNTDPTRCGMPYAGINERTDPKQMVEKIVRFALDAHDISKNIPFKEIEDQTFDTFIYHLTTIFTDVRLNLKGPTIELRTLDSMPVEKFEPIWKTFISRVEKI